MSRNDMVKAQALIVSMYDAFRTASSLLADGKDEQLRVLLDFMVQEIPDRCAEMPTCALFSSMEADAAGYGEPSQIVPGIDDCIDYLRS